MSEQFYQPDPSDLVACDDGLHFILLDEANDHCNWVMRRHPDGGLVSIRKATEHELAHAKVRQHLRAGVAQLEGSEVSKLAAAFDEAAEQAAFIEAFKLDGKIYRDSNTKQWLPTRDSIEGFQMAERTHGCWVGWLVCAKAKAGVQ